MVVKEIEWSKMKKSSIFKIELLLPKFEKEADFEDLAF